MKLRSTAVIGAGPYGLSIAAHLKAAGVSTQVFGKPMEFWQGMPSEMCLKSPWSASSLRDPTGAYNLDRFTAAVDSTRPEPIPLAFYLRYGRWFEERNALDVEPTYVRNLQRDGENFRLELADGRNAMAGRVVVAIGISGFKHTPQFAAELKPPLCWHTQDVSDPTVFRDRRVAVIGRGQSALEWAALLHEAGAEVEVIARGPVHWISRRLAERTGPAKRLFYPPTDVGPPGINWLVAFPRLMRHFPVGVRAAMHRRSIRPAGAKWLRSRVEGPVTISEGKSIRGVAERGRQLRLELDDGTARVIDHLLLGTGYRPQLEKIAFSILSFARGSGSGADSRF